MRKRGYQYVPPLPAARENDYRLAFEALHGAAGAWDALYEEAYPFVLREVKRFDDRHFFADGDHEEITDEAFERCYEQLERYQGLSRFQRWVLGYAKNIMRNRRRRQLTARRNQYLMWTMEASRKGSLDPLYILIRLERDQCLWSAFYQLPDPDQTILFQRLFLNVPPKRIAKELQLTRKQIAQRYEEALVVVRWRFIRSYR